MAKYTGVSPLNKSKTVWKWRIKMTTADGRVIDKVGSRDENGEPFKTALDAFTASEKVRAELLSQQI